MYLYTNKINREKYNKICFISDCHINHNRTWIVEPRNVKSIEEHDDFVKSYLFDLTGDDLLINLGDFTLTSSVEETESILSKIKATHFYIFGNHESFVSKIYYKYLSRFFADNNLGETGKFMDLYPFNINFKSGDVGIVEAGKAKKGTITFLGESSQFKFNNFNFDCRHMAPMLWDKMKYPNYVSVFGHSHGNLDGCQPQDFIGKKIDIGVDNAKKFSGKPYFLLEEIVDIMSTKELVVLDHHG